MCNYKKIKNLLTAAFIILAFISIENKPSSAQTLPNFFDPPLSVYVMELSDGYSHYFCLDQYPLDLFDQNTLSMVTSVYPWAVPASELAPEGIIDLNRDGQVSGVECELYGGMYDDQAPYLGPQNNGVIPIPGWPPGSTFDANPPANRNPLL